MADPDQKLFEDAYAEAKQYVADHRGSPHTRLYRFAVALIQSVEGESHGSPPSET